MVNIIEKSQEERDMEKRVSTLEKITKEFKKDKKEDSYVIGNIVANSIYISSITETLSKGILVICDRNEIKVHNSKDYDFAWGLADKYEKSLNENWTLKKDYNE